MMKQGSIKVRHFDDYGNSFSLCEGGNRASLYSFHHQIWQILHCYQIQYKCQFTIQNLSRQRVEFVSCEEIQNTHEHQVDLKLQLIIQDEEDYLGPDLARFL